MEPSYISSLNENFLDQYKGSMAMADEAIVYFNPHTRSNIKKLKPVSENQVKTSFGNNQMRIVTDSKKTV